MMYLHSMSNRRDFIRILVFCLFYYSSRVIDSVEGIGLFAIS